MTIEGTIRKLLPAEKRLFRDHLMRLDTEARRKRFTHSVADSFIERYAKKSGEPGTIVYGYFENGQMRGAAELKWNGRTASQTAEAAFSVESEYANKGVATELMGRVIRSARNRGFRHLVLFCLPDNAKMQAIASKYHADLRFEDGAVIGDIVPERPDYFSFAAESFEDRVGYLLAIIDVGARFKTAA